MRIIAGTLKGHTFGDPPRLSYHPMGEKMRGAIFNALGDIEGLAVLDPFGGTGALSFEAISRGAQHAQVLESDKRVFANLTKNVQILGVESKVKATLANASSWSDNNPEHLFDLVLLDPPYDSIKMALIDKLANHAKPKGVVVVSHPPRVGIELSADQFELLVSKSYGDGNLVFYRKLK